MSGWDSVEAARALTLRCPWCDAIPGQRCMMLSDWARRPHAARSRLGLAVAAHADPALDGWPQFGPVSPCGLCGVPGLPQRHRVVDGIAGMLAAGESPEVTGDEHGVPPEAVLVVRDWAKRWPGAWR